MAGQPSGRGDRGIAKTAKYGCGIAGVLALSLSIGLTWYTVRFRRMAVHAVGTVVDFRASREWSSSDNRYRWLFSPVVDFQGPNGMQRFVDGVRSGGRDYKVGEKVAVLYRPGAPESAQMDTFFRKWFLPGFWGLLGAVFGGIGLGFAIADWRRRRARRWLVEHGTHVYAPYSGVVIDNSVSVNRRTPWRLTCRWTDPTTGQVYPMQSDWVWYDPTPYVRGDTLHVVLDPKNPTRYRVDIDFLPENG